MLEFTTQRLEIRFGDNEDSTSIFELYSGRREESYYLARKPHSSVEATKQLLKNWSSPLSWRNNSRASLVIVTKSSRIPFGLLTLFSKEDELEFHFGLSNDYAGKGFATEVIKGLIENTSNCKQFKTLMTYCDVEHKASHRVMEKSGFSALSVSKAKYENPNQNHKAIDCINYEINLLMLAHNKRMQTDRQPATPSVSR